MPVSEQEKEENKTNSFTQRIIPKIQNEISISILVSYLSRLELSQLCTVSKAWNTVFKNLLENHIYSQTRLKFPKDKYKSIKRMLVSFEAFEYFDQYLSALKPDPEFLALIKKFTQYFYKPNEIPQKMFIWALLTNDEKAFAEIYALIEDNGSLRRAVKAAYRNLANTPSKDLINILMKLIPDFPKKYWTIIAYVLQEYVLSLHRHVNSWETTNCKLAFLNVRMRFDDKSKVLIKFPFAFYSILSEIPYGSKSYNLSMYNCMDFGIKVLRIFDYDMKIISLIYELFVEPNSIDEDSKKDEFISFFKNSNFETWQNSIALAKYNEHLLPEGIFNHQPRNSKNFSLLHDAVSEQKYDKVEYLLKHNIVAPDLTTSDGYMAHILPLEHSPRMEEIFNNYLPESLKVNLGNNKPQESPNELQDLKSQILQLHHLMFILLKNTDVMSKLAHSDKETINNYLSKNPNFFKESTSNENKEDKDRDPNCNNTKR